MVETQNLWPDFKAETIPSPKKIMMEQALFLKEKTNGRVYAQVVTEDVKYHNDGINAAIKLQFQIIVPALGNYRYTLFRIIHDVDPYPVTISYDNSRDYHAHTLEEFKEILSKIFNSEDTIKKISTLLSYE